MSGHGVLCGHPDFLNWVSSKIKLDENLMLKLNVEPEDTDRDIIKKFIQLRNPIQEASSMNLQVWKHNVPEELYSTTFVKEHIIEFLEKFARGNYSKDNFFMFCSFPDPHHPFSPPGKYFNMFNPEDIILPNSFKDTHEHSTPVNRKHYEGD